MTYHGIDFAEDRIREFCQRHQIRRLAVFGSILRDGFRPESDIDVLVEFEPDAVVGLIRLAGIEIELGRLLGRHVDMNTTECLSRYFRDDVEREAEALYVAA